jgi:hypothetical protein
MKHPELSDLHQIGPCPGCLKYAGFYRIWRETTKLCVPTYRCAFCNTTLTEEILAEKSPVVNNVVTGFKPHPKVELTIICDSIEDIEDKK